MKHLEDINEDEVRACWEWSGSSDYVAGVVGKANGDLSELAEILIKYNKMRNALDIFKEQGVNVDQAVAMMTSGIANDESFVSAERTFMQKELGTLKALVESIQTKEPEHGRRSVKLSPAHMQPERDAVGSSLEQEAVQSRRPDQR